MNPTLSIILFAALTAAAVAAVAYAVLLPRIDAEKKTESRLKHYKKAETDSVSRRQSRDRVQEVARRRRTLQSSLKDVETKQKEHDKHTTKVPLDRRIAQAGWKMTIRQFVVFSLVLGLAAAVAAMLLQGSLLIACGIAVIGGLGLPRWLLNWSRKRRQKKFVVEFANAIDVIVRGIKSGLPLNDTLRIIATEAAEPVRSEFRRVIESQQMGLSTSEAVERLYQSMPLSETNFFAIVVSIQSQAGGNLAEALANLSRVLRGRKQMEAKIQAMSMEAKASGAIIGALPLIVMTLTYLSTPDYIALLFTTSTGNMILAASGTWMFIGIYVMKQMINFDF